MTEPDHIHTTRAAYDAAAGTYARWVGTELAPATERPVDLAMLGVFADLVTARADRRVVDVGCGTGRVAGFLARRGMDVVGVDLSPAMLAIATATHPGIDFREGRLTDLPVGDRSVSGAVYWYSIIHTPPDDLADVAIEMARVLVPGGHLLVAFQAGAGESRQRPAYGTDAVLTSYRHDVPTVVRHLTGAGLPVHTRTLREPELAHESTPQAFLLARSAR